MRCIVLSDSAQIGCYSNLVLNSDLRWRGFYTTERQRDRETERRGDKETGRQGDFVSPSPRRPVSLLLSLRMRWLRNLKATSEEPAMVGYYKDMGVIYSETCHPQIR